MVCKSFSDVRFGRFLVDIWCLVVDVVATLAVALLVRDVT